ncbi:MAG: 4Fe-4S binding protein [Spirochaetales bacterium]|jgi:dihydroorotate dehydrogenase (NAD+) catalytic subunit|nr:4Fe-4S binding protein [Spirochaetales bacterium]
MSVSLETDFCGISFKNPIIVPAGVHGRDGKTIRDVSASGVAGICTKTIVSQPASDVLPCFAPVSGGMVNSVFGSDKPSEYWFSEGIKTAKDGQALVLANLAGFSAEEAADLAVKAEKSGADMIIVPTHCPHMGEILMAMFPGMEYPEPKLTNLDPMKDSIKQIKQAVKIPVVVKLSGTFSHITRDWAIGVKESGADGIACSDAMGPALAIDIDTGEPLLGGPRGVGGLTGPAIMPITLRMVMEIAMAVDLPIIAVGGVSSAVDALKYMMVGASLVGVCTAGHVNGIDRYTRIIKNLTSLLQERGASSPKDVRGLTLARIAERKKQNRTAVTEPQVPAVNADLCTACGKCETVCAYGSAVVDRFVKIDQETCVGCGLCVSVCPTKTLSQSYYTN